MTCINGNSSAVSVTTAELKQLVEKKATFEAAVRELKAKLQDPRLPEPALAELLQLSSRVATLLKTRYANPAFFRAGSDLFKAAIVGVQSCGGAAQHVTCIFVRMQGMHACVHA